jgi:hypothetical protein
VVSVEQKADKMGNVAKEAEHKVSSQVAQM